VLANVIEICLYQRDRCKPRELFSMILKLGLETSYEPVSHGGSHEGINVGVRIMRVDSSDEDLSRITTLGL